MKVTAQKPLTQISTLPFVLVSPPLKEKKKRKRKRSELSTISERGKWRESKVSASEVQKKSPQCYIIFSVFRHYSFDRSSSSFLFFFFFSVRLSIQDVRFGASSLARGRKAKTSIKQNEATGSSRRPGDIYSE